MVNAEAPIPRLLQRDDTDSAAVIVWASVVLSVMRISLETSNRLILWQAYGWQKVQHEHLSIVRVKPQLVVSNGDILRGLGPLHFLYGIALWIPLTFAILVPLLKYAAPDWWRRVAGARRWTPQPRAIGIVTLFIMFFAIPGFLPALPALSLGALATTAGLFWLRWGSQNATSAV